MVFGEGDDRSATKKCKVFRIICLENSEYSGLKKMIKQSKEKYK